MRERGRRKTAVGIVTSDKMQKTIVVERTTLKRHARYGKYIKRRSRYVAHDENRTARLGDTVEIMQTRPMSKTKRWRLLRVVGKVRATQARDEQLGPTEAEAAQAP